MNFLRDLREYDKDNIPVSFIAFFSISVILLMYKIFNILQCYIKHKIVRP